MKIDRTHCKLENGKIYVGFDYNEKLKDRIKEIPGREWNSVLKKWILPLDDESLEGLEEINEDIRGDKFDVENLRDQIEAQQRHKEKAMANKKEEIAERYPFLYDWQMEDVAKAVTEKDLLLLLDMGLGKTIESLCIADYLKEEHGYKTMFMVKASNVHHWREEYEKFEEYLPNIDPKVIDGKPEERAELYDKYEEAIVSYGKIYYDHEDIQDFVKRGVVITDEATKYKNEDTEVNKKLRSLNPYYKFGLTGTIVENDLQEAKVIANTIKPNWMSDSEWYEKYCTFKEINKPYLDEPKTVFDGYINVDKFREKLERIAIRRTKDDLDGDFPEKVRYDRYVPMNDEQNKIRRELRNEIEGLDEIAKYSMFQMLEDDPKLLVRSDSDMTEGISYHKESSPKLDELMDIVHRLDDDKVLIFTRYKEMTKMIAQRIGSETNDQVKIATGDSDKEKVINQFKEQDRLRFMIATDAYNEGVDLPFVTTVINYDLRWNPAKMKQREDRAHRVTSQADQLKIYTLVATGLESTMWDALKEKDQLFQQVTDFNKKKQFKKFLSSIK